MKDKLYIAMKIGPMFLQETMIGSVAVNPKLELPDGCEGAMLVFRTKKAAYDFWGNDVELVEIKKA